MLIIALVLAVIGLAALVTAVVTSNELIAWVCIGASVLGVVLLIVDALRERSRGTAEKSADETPAAAETTDDAVEDYPDEPAEAPAAEAESADAADETTEAKSAGAESAEAESDEAKSDEAESDEARAGSDETAAEAAEDDTHDAEPTAEESAEEHKN
ncbi:hypothetical protein [Mycolicibacterium brisbanense]|uniref:Transmembrane protein n=1 Tax=Mycolicibacterium brisbanense TaxID=146020 RepID=A0A100W1V8_9MYCO|nr:hypothetical protein [Mycolicibacterium brisbanense]MCV7162362.1 hypothetical protein [Mycolicibacterium brisbanense]GAS90118.1 transmembrane protein [Mycolicibacterium brisbanense]